MRLAERPYQYEAVHGGREYPGIFKALRDGTSTLLVLPCGCGKTVVFSQVVEACVKRGKRALILAHREELIESARQKLIDVTSVGHFDIGIEMASSRAAERHAVVIASVPSLQGKRLAALDPAEFGLVVVDECHHIISKTYRNIIEHFRGVKLLGVTATPDRLDGKGLGAVFESVAYAYEIADAIRDGYLVRVTGRMIRAGDAMDLTNVRTTAGDFNHGDLAEVLEKNPAVALVAKGTVDEAGDRKTLIFAVSVAQARAIAEHINTYTGRQAAVALDGSAPPEVRRDVKRRYERGEFQYLVNCQLYGEGVDIPAIQCVSLACPTKSRARYTQQLGRGLRLLGATIEESIAAGKSEALILDFTGVTGKHKLVSCFDVLDGNADEEVRRRVLKRAQAGPIDALEQLELASQEIVEEQRLRALADVKYRAIAMADPFTVLGVRPRKGRHGGRPATLEQLEKLARHKIPGAEEQLIRQRSGTARDEEPFDYGQAQDVLWGIAKRVRKGLCTVRQARVLIKHGLNPDASWEKARWALDEIAGNRWQPTPAVLADPELRVATESGGAA